MSKTIGECIDNLIQDYKVKPCPRCNKVSDAPPALCRRDNKTEICSDCGLRQAMEDFATRSNPKEDRHI